MPRPPASQKAFTLIEVMMAATVLVVSFSAIIQAVTMGADMIDTARKQQIAQQIIEGEITHQRTTAWASVTYAYGVSNMIGNTYRIRVNDDGAGVTPETAVTGTNDMWFFSIEYVPQLMAVAKGFTCQVSAANLRSAGLPPLISLTYTVTWKGFNGRPHTRTSVAHFSQNGLNLTYLK